MSGDPQQDTDALAAFAVAVRPDWQEWAVRASVGEALHNGWPWKRIVAEVVRLLWVPDALPADLVPAQQPVKQALTPDRTRAHAAAARAGLPATGGRK